MAHTSHPDPRPDEKQNRLTPRTHTSSGAIEMSVTATLFHLAICRSTASASRSLLRVSSQRGDSGTNTRQQAIGKVGMAVRRAIHLQLWPRPRTTQETTATKRDPTAHIAWVSTRILDDRHILCMQVKSRPKEGVG